MNRLQALAKGRAIMARRRAEREGWTQEQVNEEYERQFLEHDQPVDAPDSNEPETHELKAEKLVRPIKPTRKRNPDAQKLGLLGWTSERREAVRQRMRGNHLRKGAVPWNVGKTKKNDPTMKFCSDFKKWQIELNSREV